MRRALALLLIAGLLPITWLREPLPLRRANSDVRFIPLALPSPAELARHLGPFRLEGAWRMVSRDYRFGGYSGLLPMGDGQLLAVSDRGVFLRFSPPGSGNKPPEILLTYQDDKAYINSRDSESATRDPATGRIWIGWETGNAISRHDAAFKRSTYVRPAAMRDWGSNLGPEAMVRLADGRFIVLAEGFTGWWEDRRHEAVLFAGDPIRAKAPMRFAFDGPARFSPTDMAQLPDGRVLILMRRAVWPMPARFAGRIVIADPTTIRPGRIWQTREVAKLSSSLPVDNFEGLAIEPRRDGKVTVWLISDDNLAVMQRTLLWKLVLDPADLP